jgi:signal transduction histidine kinase
MGDAGGDILIVDDYPDTLTLFESFLHDDGHRVRTARSGVEALRHVDEREPEVVLLDVSMPGLDGVEVLKRLRARRGGGPSVLMLTAARREPHAIEAGLKEGADAYLTKPIDGRELTARVRAALETFRLKRMLEAQRRDHIAMLVHDLRHPLSSLGLIAEVIDSEEMTPAERHASVMQIRGMCTEMARLVDGVLVASRLEAGVFAVEPRAVKVRAIIEPMLAVFTPVATRRRVTLVFDGSLDLEIHADPQKLRQAVDNLVANALKFTPRGGKVSVRVAREPAGVVLEISDTGPGIAEAERATIFDRYKQGSRGRAAGGAGLGLAIARGIAEAHHGTIEVTNRETGGASFRIVLPG